MKLLANHHPENSELLKLGELYGNRKQFDIAREKLEKALKLQPNLHNALFLLAKIDILTAKYPESTKKLVQLNKIFPNNVKILEEI
ncbi:MAG: tetratricopeptide repeat protein, partial [Promethearchaeia archaeon]